MNFLPEINYFSKPLSKRFKNIGVNDKDERKKNQNLVNGILQQMGRRSIGDKWNSNIENHVSLPFSNPICCVEF